MATTEWRRVFLRALGRTGNVAAAVRVAGVNRSTADRARRRDGRFAAAWARAVETARTRVRVEQAGVIRTGVIPTGVFRAAGSEKNAGPGELVFRASANHGPQLVKAARWTKAAESRFFACLEETGSAGRAAAAAGFSRRALYARKARDPRFAAAWRAATARGRETLHLLVVGAGVAAFGGGDDADGEAESGLPRATLAEAIAILKLGDDGTGRPRGRPGGRAGAFEARVPDLEEVKEGIARKLAVIRRARERV